MSKVSKKIKFKCEYCDKEFQQFSTLSSHSKTCEIGSRKHNEGTSVGILAHNLWCLSFVGTRRKNFSYDIFIRHRDYRFFFNLSSFCHLVRVISPEQYMDWCIKEKIKLKLWTDETVYSRFVKYFVVHEDPIDAVLRSIKYIKNVETCDYFNEVSPGSFLIAIEMGRISPWLYLLYHGSDDILEQMNEEQVSKLNKLIDRNVWSILLKKHKNICEEIKKTLAQEIL